jgi:hypothetical protein
MNERELSARILENLTGVREDMLALIELVWDSVNRRDAASRDAGHKYAGDLERQLKSVEAASSGLSQLFKQRVGMGDEELPGNKPGTPTTSTDPVFSRYPAHRLALGPGGRPEDFTSTKPLGYTLQGKAAKNLTNWSEVYLSVCRELARRDPSRFVSLADNPRIVTSHSNLILSRSASKFNVPRLVTGNIYAELNLSANAICSRLRLLFDAFGIPHTEMQIFLKRERREDDVA